MKHLCLVLYQLKKPSLKFILSAAASLLLAALILNNHGNRWEEDVRSILHKLTNDSIPVYVTELVDSNGIPYVHYAKQNGVYPGYQYNPTIVANYAINYYQSSDHANQAKFFNCIDWLMQHTDTVNGYVLYSFNWQQPWYLSVKTPYTSGMTSGRAIEALCYAYSFRKKAVFLSKARQLMRGYYLPIQQGGFTYKEPNGWWYEELADTNLQTPRILDGHIYALLGLYRLVQTTGSDSARFLYNKGIAALKHSLPKYQCQPNWSCYDGYGSPSDKKYHKILTSQMQQLATITGDLEFINCFTSWNKALNKPYVIRVIGERNISGFVLYALLSTGLFLLLLLALFIVRKLNIKN